MGEMLLVILIVSCKVMFALLLSEVDKPRQDK